MFNCRDKSHSLQLHHGYINQYIKFKLLNLSNKFMNGETGSRRLRINDYIIIISYSYKLLDLSFIYQNNLTVLNTSSKYNITI